MKPGEEGGEFSQTLYVGRARKADAYDKPVEFIPVHQSHYQLTNALLNISSTSIFTISSVRLASTALRSRALL